MNYAHLLVGLIPKEPPSKRRTATTPGAKPKIGAKVIAAIEAGHVTAPAIAAYTGLPRRKVARCLHDSLQRYGFARRVSEGPGAIWRLT